MYYLIWEYEVEKPHQTKFEEEYSRSGTWFKLFEPCSDFMGHELIKNTSGESYLVIDKWMDKESYDSFISSVKLEYDNLNQTFKSLYTSEKQVGTFLTL